MHRLLDIRFGNGFLNFADIIVGSPMTLIVSFSSLLVSVVLLQLSSGILGPLDVLSGYELNFSTTQIGLLGSSHFIGFFIGCWWAPRLVSQVNHSRCFAVFASLGTIGILLHMVFIDPYAWAAMRTLSGMCVAGCFTVIEGWIQAKTENQNRGKSLRLYRSVDMCGGIVAQIIIAWLTPAHYITYNLIAIICCASLLPLALTRIPPPKTQQKLRLKPKLAYQISPMATAGVVVSGITTAGFRMVGPIYGTQIGLNNFEMGIFLASFLVGGAIAQFPTGWVADKIDRRTVLIFLSFLATLACILTIYLPGHLPDSIFGAIIVLGFFTYPIYSVSAALANDHANPDQMVEVSASLLFYYALGAIISPYFISGLIESFGVNAMFTIIALFHVALVVFGVIRMRLRPSPEQRTNYVYTPRTSYLLGRLLRKSRKKSNEGK